jgi:hypothetical protein
MKAIEQLRSGLMVGHAQTAMHGTRRGTVGQVVHDGDTVALDPLRGLSVRFLGVDAPEVSFTLPGGAPDRFVPITDEVNRPGSDGGSGYWIPTPAGSACWAA